MSGPEAVTASPVSSLRALADRATPGPWTAHEGDLEGGSPLDYVATLLGNRESDGTTTGRLFLTLAPNPIDPELGAEVVPATTGDGPQAEANAEFIAAARTALPALCDLYDEVERRADEISSPKHGKCLRINCGDCISNDLASRLRAALSSARRAIEGVPETHTDQEA